MTSTQHVLLSIHSRHVRRIVDGEKTVEFRRARVRLTPPTQLWLYETAPTKRVVATVVLTHVTYEATAQLLRYEHDVSEQRVLIDYLQGKAFASALHLQNPRLFAESLTVQQLGIAQAPQSYCRMRHH